MRYAWEPYLNYSYKKKLKKGDRLFAQGEISAGFYYLAKGKIFLQLISEDGKERIIDYIIEGYLLGEQGINGQPYSTTAICDTDVILYYFSSDSFTKICRKHPEANRIFMNSLISNVRSLVDTINMMNKPYEQQIAYSFLKLSKKNDDGPFSITQISLAKYIGTSRVTVYKIMQKWLKEGIISRQGNTIQIVDVNRLQALSIDEQKEMFLKKFV